jgi:PKD repeat protein
MKSLLNSFFVLLICLALGGASYAQSYTLRLKAGDRVPLANVESFIQQPDLQPADYVAGKAYRFVQFFEIPQAAQRAAMEAAGLELLSYVPHHTYVAALSEKLEVSKLADWGVRSVTRIRPTDKLHVTAMTGPHPDWAMEGNQLKVLVKYQENLSPERVDELLASWSASSFFRYDYTQLRGITIDPNQVHQLAAQPFVAYVEVVPPPAEPENNESRTSSRSNVLFVHNNAGRQYDGDSVDVAINDSGIIGPHIDYQGRIITENTSSNSSNHGDHVAGTVGGAGNLNPWHQGAAPGANFHVYSHPTGPVFNSFPGIYNTPQKIRITQTSFSDGCNTGYTSSAQMMDMQIRTLPSLSHVFSAGNSGSSSCGGLGNGWRTITGGNKAAKGPIAVGNMTDNDVIANSSSRGPATDGRIKPDICAIGTDVTSTIDPNTYDTFTGTSMAAPAVSGLLAQLYQAYRARHGGADPQSGLIKAILLNTADDFGDAGPDFTYGWGKANGLKAVRVIEEDRWLDSTITQGGINTHTFTMPAGVSKAKIMVYWTDQEANLMAAPALVNNLDAGILDPMLTPYAPWVLDPGPNPTVASVTAPAGVGNDTLNNMEQIEINNPMAGTYSLNISGTTVTTTNQSYYVVFEYVRDLIDVTYPVGGESFAPGDQIRIRWDDLGTTGVYNVNYTIDNGVTWNTVGTAVGSRRYLDWTVPNGVVSGACRIRVTNGPKADISDASFSIIGIPTNLRIEQVCQGYTRIAWDSVPGASGYDVFMLGNKYMDFQGSTPALNYDVTAANFMQSNWFSVRARGVTNSTIGRRAIAIQSQPGLLNCAPTAPVSNFATPASSCMGNTVTLIDQSTNGPTSWNWSISPATFTFVNATNATSSSPDVVFNATGTYTITLVTTNFAGADTVEKIVNVNFQSPIASFTYSPGGLGYIFINQSVGAFYYDWDFGDGTTSTLENPSHTYATGGTYLVRLEVSSPCGTVSTSQSIRVIGTDVDDLINQWGLSVVPNPSNGQVVLRAERPQAEELSLQVLDLRGQQLREYRLAPQAGAFRKNLDLSKLAAGLYLLRVSNGQQASSLKIVIQ